MKQTFKDKLIPIPEADAIKYASNSFQTTYRGKPYLFVPQGLSNTLLSRIKSTGVIPVEVDVSEFMKKGGGSVKCMIGDLGPLIDDPEKLTENQKKFREEHNYKNLFR